MISTCTKTNPCIKANGKQCGKPLKTGKCNDAKKEVQCGKFS